LLIASFRIRVSAPAEGVCVAMARWSVPGMLGTLKCVEAGSFWCEDGGGGKVFSAVPRAAQRSCSSASVAPLSIMACDPSTLDPPAATASASSVCTALMVCASASPASARAMRSAGTCHCPTALAVLSRSPASSTNTRASSCSLWLAPRLGIHGVGQPMARMQSALGGWRVWEPGAR
jgi:hypothetical protein